MSKSTTAQAKARPDAAAAYDLVPTHAAFADRLERAIEELTVLEYVARGPLSVGDASYGAGSAVKGLLTPIYEARRGLLGAYGAVGGRLREPIA